MKAIARTFLSLAAALLFVSSARAVTCYALTDVNHLLVFDSSSPGTAVDKGLIANIGAYDLVGMAMRITTQTSGAANAGVGSVWALGYNGTDFKLFTITPSSATATAVSGALTGMSSAVGQVGNSAWGFSFNPATDRFQAVGVFFNFTIDPNTLSAVRDTNVFTIDSGNNVNNNPAFSGAAFSTASFGGTSKFYIADTGVHQLDSSTDIAAGGAIHIFGVANYGAGLNGGQPNGMAISDSTALFAPSTGNLYNLNLTSGAASMIGAISGNPGIRSLVIVPSSFPPTLPVTVKISGKKRVVTTKAVLVVKGTAASEADIKLVQYKVGKAGFRNAIGTTSWRARVRLKPGLNLVSAQATGGNDAKSALAKVRIIRQ